MPLMRRLFLSLILITPSFAAAADVEIREDILEDKIRGGLLGQILGNLNGLPHEMKYIDKPGNVETYTPSLPDGARTDDDTDIEWVYLVHIPETGSMILQPKQITELWKKHINRGIWCANLYARRLMDLGIEPPLTGHIAINPWSNFNISGSFLAETWALISPGMPQTAAKIALNFTHVAIDGEPAQTTQFVTAMISTSFFERDIDKIIDNGLGAVDPKSVIHGIAKDVRAWHEHHHEDWRATRLKIRDKYTHYNGEMADRNGYELNTAATIASLLYGRGDFEETLRMAFNFGWDADNNAATVGSILGVIRGRAWMDTRGWNIKDVYKNTTRDQMPDDETISTLGIRLSNVARKAIVENGGQVLPEGRGSGAAGVFYKIRTQTPLNIEPLPQPLDRMPELVTKLKPQIEKDLAGSAIDRTRAAYLAICLDLADTMKQQHPQEWKDALQQLQKNAIVKELFSAPRPMGPLFQKKALDAGLHKP
jgi:ADP-ribosylglycohydrolase